MKITPLMLCSISVWVLWSAHLVWAKEEGGAGTVGGGERVGAVLRDLRDEGRCTVEFASDFVQHEAPATWKILSALAEVDWPFAETLRWQLEGLRICAVEGRLADLPADNTNEYVYYRSLQRKLVAVRPANQPYVYIEAPQFLALGGEQRALILLRMALVDTFPTGPERERAITSLVRLLSENFRARMSPDRIEFILAETGAFGPGHIDIYKPLEAAFSSMLDTSLDEAARLAAQAQVESTVKAHAHSVDAFIRLQVCIADTQSCGKGSERFVKSYQELRSRRLELFRQSILRGDLAQFETLTHLGLDKPTWEDFLNTLSTNRPDFAIALLQQLDLANLEHSRSSYRATSCGSMRMGFLSAAFDSDPRVLQAMLERLENSTAHRAILEPFEAQVVGNLTWSGYDGPEQRQSFSREFAQLNPCTQRLTLNLLPDPYAVLRDAWGDWDTLGWIRGKRTSEFHPSSYRSFDIHHHFTALSVAVDLNQPEMARTILRALRKITAREPQWLRLYLMRSVVFDPQTHYPTPILTAARERHFEQLARELEEAGATVDMTPRQWIREFFHSEATNE